jgi:hypothetical protein
MFGGVRIGDPIGGRWRIFWTRSDLGGTGPGLASISRYCLAAGSVRSFTDKSRIVRRQPIGGTRLRQLRGDNQDERAYCLIE